LLGREGLYSSHLALWRKQRDQGQIEALTDNSRGRKPQTLASLLAENRKLQQENQQLTQGLKRAEALLEIQKKSSKVLGVVLNGIQHN